MWLKAFTIGMFAMALFACRPSSAGTKAPTIYSRATVYFVPWEIVTGVGLAPNAVRDAARVTHSVHDDGEMQKLLAVLDLPALHAPPTNPGIQGDFRLMIDLVRADTGATESFAADRGKLVRIADGASRPIDDSFRKYFSSIK